jgi:hypothetical protein
MARCTTASRPYRCNRELDANGRHQGDCETEDMARPTLGPYTDGHRARAYLRGQLDALSGSELGAFGVRFLCPRKTDEDDATYRERIWRSR